MKTLSQNKHKSGAPKTPETFHLPTSVQPINNQIKSQLPSLPSLLINPQKPSFPLTITLELLRIKHKTRHKEVLDCYETFGCYTISNKCKPATFVSWQSGIRKIALSQNRHSVIIPAHIGDCLAIDIFHQSRHYTAIYQASAHTNHQPSSDPEKLIRPLSLILNLKYNFNGYTFFPLSPPSQLIPLIHSIWRFTEGAKTTTYHIPPISEYHTKRKKLF